METLEEQQSTTPVDRLAALPSEIIQEILFRLPLKSILRFGSVSKPWLSLISDPSFTQLHFTRATAAHRAALFFSFHDFSTWKRYFFFAAHDGGTATHIMTLDDPFATDFTEAEHLNGLVFFTCTDWCFQKSYQIVFNPSTRKVFELPDPPATSLTNLKHVRYLFGFDESRNEHKILMIRQLLEPAKFEVMIFSLSNYSWRKIDAQPPVGFSSSDRLPYEIHSSVCVNSVIHLVPRDTFEILTFDLITEKFSMIGPPLGVVPHQYSILYTRKGWTHIKSNKPCLVKNNGCIGVICHDRLVETNELHIWVLQDYENRVWVREITKFPVPWIESKYTPDPLEVVNMDEIILSSSKVSMNEICLQIHNKNSISFRSLQFTLGDQFLFPKTVLVRQIKCYVESIVPLRSNRRFSMEKFYLRKKF